MVKGLNFITHDMLVAKAKRWLEKSHGNKFACGVVLAEYKSYADEIPDIIGFNSNRSILIECKVSRADFKADSRKSHRHYIKKLGNLRYYLTLPNVACPEDITNGWGLLYASDKKITEVKESEWFADDSVKAAEWPILYSIIRRLALRGYLKEIQKPLEKDFPEGLIPDYVGYFGVRKREGVDYSAGWYEDDWYLLKHKDFYDMMVDMKLWQERDFLDLHER